MIVNTARETVTSWLRGARAHAIATLARAPIVLHEMRLPKEAAKTVLAVCKLSAMLMCSVSVLIGLLLQTGSARGHDWVAVAGSTGAAEFGIPARRGDTDWAPLIAGRQHYIGKINTIAIHPVSAQELVTMKTLEPDSGSTHNLETGPEWKEVA